MTHSETPGLMVSMTDRQGRITYVNRAFMAATGAREADLIGQPHSRLRHPDMPRGVFAQLWETILAGEEFFCFMHNRKADGADLWTFSAVYPHRSASGEVAGFHAVHRPLAGNRAPARVLRLYEDWRGLEGDSAASGFPSSLVANLGDAGTFSRFCLDLHVANQPD